MKILIRCIFKVLTFMWLVFIGAGAVLIVAAFQEVPYGM